MGICASELRHYVIRPTLKQLGHYSADMEELLMATAAQESGLGSHLKQKHHRGMGVFHIDAKTHERIWDNYLAKNPELASLIRGLASQHMFLEKPHSELATNLIYSTAIAWSIYKSQEAPVPNKKDIQAIARCWQHYFNGKHASQTVFIKHYQEYIDKDSLAA